MIVLAAGLHQCAQVLPEFLQRRTSNKPPTIIDGVDRQVWRQRKRIGERDQAIFEIGWGHLYDPELTNRLTLMITKNVYVAPSPVRKAALTSGGSVLNNGQLAVIDLQVLLKFDKAPQLPRTFRSPISHDRNSRSAESHSPVGKHDQIPR